MKTLRFILPVLLCLCLYAGAQYRCIPSLQYHGNPGMVEPSYGGDFQNQYFNYTGVPGTVVQWQPVTQIGFPFYFNGAAVTHFKATNNGIVTFDTATAILPLNSNVVLPSASVPDKSICIKGGRPANGFTRVIVHQQTNYSLPVPAKQLWISFICLVDSGALSRHLWSIVLEENTNNIYVVNQYKSAAGNLKLTVGIQVNSSTAYMAPGSPLIQGNARNSGYATDNYYYAFLPQSPLTSDAAVTSTSLPGYLSVNRGPYTVKAQLKNLSTTTLTSAQVHYSINGGAAVTQPFAGSLASGYSNWVTFTTPFAPPVAGVYQLDIWADNLNTGSDADAANDHLIQSITVADALPLRRPVFEEYKGTWCPSSGYWTARFDSLLKANLPTASNVHYEESYVNWTYDRNQISAREYQLYNLNGLPVAAANGALLDAPDTGPLQGGYFGCPWNLSQQLIDSVSLLHGLFFMHPYLNITQDSIAHISVAVTAATSLAANNNCRLLIALIEDTITSATSFPPGNSNERQLVNTTRIMFPSYTSGIHQTVYNNADTGVFIGHPIAGHVDSFSYTYTISDPTCRPSHLFVTAFIQDTLTNEIYQSAQSNLPFTGLEPRADFEGNSSLRICAGSQVNFQNKSLMGSSYKWLFPGGSPATATTLIPPAVTYGGPGLFPVTLIATNAYGSDTFTRNQYVEVMDTTLNTVSENFESSLFLPNKWWSPGYAQAWLVDTNASGYGIGKKALTIPLSYDNWTTLRQTNLVMPHLNFSGVAHPYLRYDYAYLFNTSATPAADTLQILLSTDCGVTYDTVYVAGKDSFITATSIYAWPDSSEWKTRTIDLSAYAGAASVQIHFRLNQYPYEFTQLRLDNIQIGHTSQPVVAGFAANAQQVCAGAQVSFQNTSVDGTSYLWTFPSGIPGTSTAVDPQVTYATAGQWPVTLVTSNGNNADTLRLDNYITVYANPDVNAALVDNTICLGDTTTLQATGAASYQWSVAPNLSSTTATNPIVWPVTTTTYYVTGTDAHQCRNSDSATLLVNTPIKSSINHDTTICSVATAVLDAGSAFSAYNWSTGGTGQTITVSPGTYFLTTTDVNGCKNKDTVVVRSTICAGINTLQSGYQIELFPNPANDYVTVYTNAVTANGTLVILDAIGQQLGVYPLTNGQFTINTSLLSAGMYLVQIRTSAGFSACKKFIVKM